MLKGADTLFKLATKAFAVKTTMCNEKALIHVITRSVDGGSFNNYVDQIFPNFDHLPPIAWTIVDILPFVHVTKLEPPKYLSIVHVVIERPLIMWLSFMCNGIFYGLKKRYVKIFIPHFTTSRLR